MIQIVTPIDDLQREVWTFYPHLDFREKLTITVRSRTVETRQTKRHKWAYRRSEAAWPVPDEIQKQALAALAIEFVRSQERTRR